MSSDAELDRLLHDEIASSEGPGAVVGIVSSGQLSAVAARGRAELEHDVGLTQASVMPLASVSKHVVAYVAALLAEDGLLDLSRPIRNYVPWVPFEGISLRDLIHHTSGIRDQLSLIGLEGRLLADVSTTDHIVELLARQRDLNFEPGTRQLYSNSGYTLLALAMEAATGQTLDEICRARIFDPLDMHATSFQHNVRHVVHGRAQSYAAGDGTWLHTPLSHSHVGPTGLFSTMDDLAIWAAHAMSPRPCERLQTRIRLLDGTRVDYGLGLNVVERRGRVIMWHAGGHASFRTLLFLAPADGIATIVLANTPSVDVWRLAEGAFDAATKGAPVAGLGHDGAVAGVQTRIESGLYIEAGSGLPLAFTCGKDGRVAMRSASGDERFSKPVTLASNRAGALVSADGMTSVEVTADRLLLRLPAHSATVLERLTEDSAPAEPDLDLAGTYYSVELDALVHVEVKGDDLYLRRPVWGTRRLCFFTQHRFEVLVPEAELFSPVVGEFDAGDLFLSTNRAHRVRFSRVWLRAIDTGKD